MEFKKAFEVQKKSGGGGLGSATGNSQDEIYVSMTLGGKDRVEQITIRIGEGLMRKMRWLAGDKVRVVCGESNGKSAVMLARSQQGFMLSPTGGNKFKGKAVRCSVKFSATEEHKRHFQTLLKKTFVPFEADDACLVFCE
jgi:hypothetical protein